MQNYYVTQSGPSHHPTQRQSEQLLDQMLITRWDISQWGPLDLDSPFAQHLKQYLQRNQLNFQVEPAFSNWQLKGVNDTQVYFNNLPSQLRSTLKRKSRKLEKTFDEVQFRLVTKPAELAAALDAYEAIYQKSWKPEEGSATFIRDFCHKAAVKGWLRLGLLELDGIAVSAQIWFVYQGKASIFKLAYDPNFQAYSPGSLLTEFLMHQVLQQDQVTLVDFGMGSEPYKKDWMNTLNTRYTITAYNNTWAGQLARIRFQVLPSLKKRLHL